MGSPIGRRLVHRRNLFARGVVRAVFAGKVSLIAWGMKDIAFREKELRRWTEAFPDARVVRFAEAGHFVAEEAPDELAEEIRAIL